MSERTFPRHLKVAWTVVAVVAGTAGIVALPDKPVPSASATCTLGTGYGRMFPELPAASWALDDLSKLADAMVPTEQAEPDATKGFKFEMPGVPAGFTYVGQFIDHDITLDQRPNDLLSAVDIETLTNGRTPQLDLDSVYGAGPARSRPLSDTDGVHLRLGAPLSGAVNDPGARDLPRDPTSGQALAGDAREDENRMVASLHSIMTRFHNSIVDDLHAANPGWSAAKLFTEARQTATWYYQWAVLTDFLPRMVGFSTLESVVTREGRTWHTSLNYLRPCRSSIPVEFTGAAYRYGHSMVRDDYQLNDKVKNLPVFDGTTDPRASVGGFQPSPPDYGVDWSYFFAMGTNTPQEAYKLDASLVPALRKLPGPAAGTASTILATRNLLRGQQLSLPSGQAVARAMGLDTLADDRILIGAALGVGADSTKSITDVSPAFAGNTPLWTYVLAEAVNESYLVEGGRITSLSDDRFHLGPVGGRIVAETIVGLLQADSTSVIHHPEFRPRPPYANRFAFSDIVAKATGISTEPL
jgi:hypothetical protein